MDGPFLLPAYCSNTRKNGGKVVVVDQTIKEEKAWIVFSENMKNDYWKKTKHAYDKSRNEFISKYEGTYLPLVSIVIPAYNQPEFFIQALNSGLQQTYGNIEIIIGDDSTDERIRELIKPYLMKYSNIKYYAHDKPLGRNGINNMDFLIEKCNGKYINLLFQDDLIKEHKISTMMDYYIRDLNNEIGIITSSRYLIDERNKILTMMEGKIIGDDQILSGKVAGKRILQLGINYIGEYSTVLLPRYVLYSKKEKRYRIGVYSNLIDSSMADISTWLEVFRKGLNLVRIAEPLSAFRYHSAQNTYKTMIQIRARMDWLAFYVLSWENNDFIYSVDDLLYYCKKFINNNPLMVKSENCTKEEKMYYEKYENFVYLLVKELNFEFINAVKKYIDDNSVKLQ